MAVGLSFQPGSEQNGDRKTPVQTAVQLISTRLPTVVGARALAPQQLLSSPGGAALGGGEAVIALLRRLFQQQSAGGEGMPPQMAQGSPAPAFAGRAVPPPRIIPRVDDAPAGALGPQAPPPQADPGGQDLLRELFPMRQGRGPSLL